MKLQMPTPEALFQLAALWTAKRFRGRLRHRTGNEGEFYSDFFTDEDEDTFSWDPRARRRSETVRDAVARWVEKGGSVLDVGCGLGEVLQSLAPEYRRYGVDYAESNVRRATRRLGGCAEIQQGSAYKLPFESGCMSAVICLEVLEHLPDDRAPISEMLRVLGANGVLILAVPYTYYWPAYLGLMGHYRHYTRQSLAQLLHDAQCEIVEYLPNFPNWHQRFTRGYVAIKATYLAERRLGLAKTSLREFRLWPGFAPAIGQLEARLSRTLSADAGLPYATLPTSTFVVARRSGGA